MIITRNDLNRSKDKKFAGKIEYLKEDIRDIYLRRLENIETTLQFKYNLHDELVAKIVVSGSMVCPCAISNEDVYIPISIQEDVIFNGDEEYEFDSELDVKALVYDFISKEIPIKVVKSGKIEYPIGDGWKVMTEDELVKERRQNLDPRWAKLQEFTSDKEE